MNLSIEKIKRVLPGVYVSDNGRTYAGRVSGRKNRFATVSWSTNSAVEVCWETVQRCVNNNTAIRV